MLRSLCRAGSSDTQTINEAVRESLVAADESAAQELVYEVLFEDPVTSAYPPPRLAVQRVLKSVLSVLDAGCVAEVDDRLYAACVQGLAGGRSAPDGGGGFDGYRALELPGGGGLVVLRAAAQMGGALETGSALWSAGCALLGLVAAGALDGLLRGHVLELGAGTGVVGLGLARRGSPVSRVTLTDGQPAVVENLRHNAEATASQGALAAAVEVRRLEWGAPDLEALPPEPVDAVVGSDLVYDAGALPALAGLLARLLRPQGTAPCAVLAATRRSEETHRKLHAALQEGGLAWEPIDVPADAWRGAGFWLRLAHDRAPDGLEPGGGGGPRAAIALLRIWAAADG